MSEFDLHATEYTEALDRGLTYAGESHEFFARGRLTWLSTCLARLGVRPRKVLDFGCGIGNGTLLLLDILEPMHVVGVDVSSLSLDIARRRHSGVQVDYLLASDYTPDATFDLVVCNGVFHHISPLERRSAIDMISATLRPGGVFSFWENNPWSPAARAVMRQIPFDRDARMVWPATTRKLGRSAGLRVIRTDFHFIFPRYLGLFRHLERLVRSLPIGAQYQVLFRRPATKDHQICCGEN